MHEDVFDGEGRDLREEDAAEGVGNGGVNANEGEGGVEGLEFVELDAEGLGDDQLSSLNIKGLLGKEEGIQGVLFGTLLDPIHDLPLGNDLGNPSR